MITNRWFPTFLAAVVGIGFFTGYELSMIPRLSPAKLLNLIGLIYALLGVLVLSEFLASERWRRFWVTGVAPGISWLHSFVPVGAFIASAVFRSHPSSTLVAQFSIGFFAYSLIPLAFFNEVVVDPRVVRLDVATRWRWFGFLLVLSGVSVQLAAAAMSLKN